MAHEEAKTEPVPQTYFVVNGHGIILNGSHFKIPAGYRFITYTKVEKDFNVFEQFVNNEIMFMSDAAKRGSINALIKNVFKVPREDRQPLVRHVPYYPDMTIHTEGMTMNNHAIEFARVTKPGIIQLPIGSDESSTIPNERIFWTLEELVNGGELKKGTYFLYICRSLSKSDTALYAKLGIPSLARAISDDKRKDMLMDPEELGWLIGRYEEDLRSIWNIVSGYRNDVRECTRDLKFINDPTKRFYIPLERQQFIIREGLLNRLIDDIPNINRFVISPYGYVEHKRPKDSSETAKKAALEEAKEKEKTEQNYTNLKICLEQLRIAMHDNIRNAASATGAAGGAGGDGDDGGATGAAGGAGGDTGAAGGAGGDGGGGKRKRTKSRHKKRSKNSKKKKRR